jgi:uncharacterized protein (DUF302 family)
MRIILAALAAILVTLPAAAEDFRTIKSKYSVKDTIDRLSETLEKKGIRVMARVDHAAGAKSAGLDLKPTELLIFGNPKLGTPLMQTNRMIALDLPMKVLAWEDDNGEVHVAYTTPAALAKRHGVEGRDEIVATMTKALAGLTAAAAGAN